VLPLVNDIRTVAQSRRLPLTVQKTHYLSLHWFSSVPIGLRFIYCLIIYRTIHWCPWTSVVEPRWRQRRGFLQSVDSITIREFHRVFPVNRTHIDIHTQSRKEIARKQHLLTLWSESSTLTVQLLTSTLTPTSYSSEEGVVAGHRRQFTPGGLPDNCETHCVSGNRTHDLPITRWNKSEIKQNCQRSGLRFSRPSTVLFYFSFMDVRSCGRVK